MQDDQGEAPVEPQQPEPGAQPRQHTTPDTTNPPVESGVEAQPEQQSQAPAGSEQNSWFEPQPYAASAWQQPAQPQQVQSDARLQGEAQPETTNWWEQPAPVPDAYTTPTPIPIQPIPQYEEYDEEEAEGFSFWRWLWEGSLLVVLAFIIAFIIKAFVVQPFYIPSGSMEPTLLPGDRVLVNKFIYRFHPAETGDVVVFAAPHDAQDRDFIKRIVAVEGQTVEVRDGKVYVNGKLEVQSAANTSQDHSNYGPVTLADNNVFVMGDNRTNSSDSRVFGAFNRDRVLGEAFVIYWPMTRLRTL